MVEFNTFVSLTDRILQQILPFVMSMVEKDDSTIISCTWWKT